MAAASKYNHLSYSTRNPEQIFLRDIALGVTCRYAMRKVDISAETSAYASGDVVFAPVEIPELAMEDGGSFLVDRVKLIDKNDIGGVLDLVFLQNNVSIGTVNAAASVPAAANLVTTISVAAADYTDLGSIKIADKQNINEILAAADDDSSLYVAGIARGAISYTLTAALSVIIAVSR